MMNVRINENVYIVSNIYSVDVSPQQRLAVAAKRIFTRTEKSSQNLGCSKTSTSNTCYNEEKIINKKTMNMRIQENV